MLLKVLSSWWLRKFQRNFLNESSNRTINQKTEARGSLDTRCDNSESHNINNQIPVGIKSRKHKVAYISCTSAFTSSASVLSSEKEIRYFCWKKMYLKNIIFSVKITTSYNQVLSG